MAALTLGVAGCWPSPGQGPNRDAYNPHEATLTAATIGDLAEAWSAPLDGPIFQPVNNPSGELVTGHGGVYVNDSRTAYRFDAATGARDWEFDLPAYPEDQMPEMGQVLVAGDDVLVGYGSIGDWWGEGSSWGARVVDPATGAERITVPGGQPMAHRGDHVLLAGNQCTEGVACTATYSVVDRNTGFGSRGTIGPNLHRYAPPTLGSHAVFSTNITLNPVPASQVQAHPLTGNPASPLWVTNLGQMAAAQAPVLSPDESTLYVGTSGADEGHTLFALDAATGAILWSVDVGTQVTAAPALAGGTLYVPTSTGLVVVDDTGTILWRAQAGTWISGQPAVAGGIVYTGALDGAVRAFEVGGCGGSATCAAVWSATTGDPVISAPIVSDGHLYVVSATDNEAGRVVAFGLEGS
jgi:outer membrane protein assembly factor BamB